MRWARVALLTIIVALCQSCQQAEKRAALESEMKTAMDQVREIVNQPVPSMARTPEMRVSTYRGGWFIKAQQNPTSAPSMSAILRTQITAGMSLSHRT
jgi:hypothetical protein